MLEETVKIWAGFVKPNSQGNLVTTMLGSVFGIILDLMSSAWSSLPDIDRCLEM